MRSAKEQRKKAAARKRKPPPVLSTSEARANFAETLETAHVDNAVIGFDRYGQTVAALVPVDAIYMLAGYGHLVDSATRKDIEQGAALFAHNVPYRDAEPEAAPQTKPRNKTKTSKTKAKSSPKRASAPQRRRR